MPNYRGKGYTVTLQISKEEMKEYGEFFKAMRQSIGLTQKQMAEEVGVFSTTVYRWEKGYRIPKKDIDEIERKYREVIKKYKENE
jgi:DNA-binding XRE family transcriptional regulator